MRTEISACAIAIVLLAALGAGCASFEDESTVIDLRILAIMAEPPEIFVADPTALDPNDETKSFTSTITALVVDPKGAGRAVSYTAVACPREIDTVTAATGRNGVVCPTDEPTTRDLLDPPGGSRDTTDAGPEHSIVLPFAASPHDLVEGVKADPSAALGFQLAQVVQLQLAAGTESIVATKRVIFSVPVMDRPPQTPNQNPTVTSVMVYPERDAQAMLVGDGEPLDKMPRELRLGGHLWIEPRGAIAEAYVTRALTHDNPPVVVTRDVPEETLRHAFYTNAGVFSPTTTSTIKQPFRTNLDQIHVESQYTAPKVMPDDPHVTIWIVTRDERGGASWLSREVTLVAP